MAAGRRPKPTHLKLVQGNPGKRALNGAEPKPERVPPSPPDHLTDAARVAWGRLTVLLDRMGVLTQADAYALERLAELYAEIVDLSGVLQREGRTYESATQNGTIIRPRPEAAMLADADRRFRAYLIEFGLTPAARSKVKADGEGATESDPAAAYFG